MSLEDIARYVRQTPGNTNPQVVKSMAQSYAESQRVQADWAQNDSTAKDYVKNRTHYEYTLYNFTYDGILEGKETIQLDANTILVKVANIEDIDLTKLKLPDDVIGAKITGVQLTEGKDPIYAESLIELDNITGDENLFLANSDSYYIGCIAALEDTIYREIIIKKGIYLTDTYLAGGDIRLYATSFSKTNIHKIDEKYLPITSADIEEINYAIADHYNSLGNHIVAIQNLEKK